MSREFKIYIFLIILSIGSIFAITRSIFIWDAVPSATYQHPDSSHTFMIHPRDAWIEAIEKLQRDSTGAIYGLKDTLYYSWSAFFPFDLNPYHIIIISMGWAGAGAAVLSPAQQALLINHLNRTSRDPDTQTALIIEGNNFAYLYCDTSSTHYTYASPFADYVGALLRFSDAGHPGDLVGEPGSLAEGLVFRYATTSGGPSISLDDIYLNSSAPYASHAAYIFNASSKSPARGLQRRSYSPGAVVLLPFQFGNIQRGANTKEQLLARIIDLAVVPIPIITHDLAGETLQVGYNYSVDFSVWDNKCVKLAIFDYSYNAGGTWHTLDTLVLPPSIASFHFRVPATPGTECYLRMFAYDSVGNFLADTVGPFVIYDPGFIEENKNLPSRQSIFAYPNPFNSFVKISVNVDVASKVVIYDVSGRIVAEYSVDAPSAEIIWDGSSIENIRQSSGVYLARISGLDRFCKIIYLK